MLIGLAVGVVAVQLADRAAAKEARPPKWSRDVLDTFFDDAREKLVGQRPDYGSDCRSDTTRRGERSSARGDATEFAWSKLDHDRDARSRSQATESIGVERGHHSERIQRRRLTKMPAATSASWRCSSP